MRSAAGETGDRASIIAVSAHGDAHSPQCQDGFFPSPLIPKPPAFGVKPCMRPRLSPERHDNGTGRFRPAAPCAASRLGGSGMLVQPFDGASFQRPAFGLAL